MGSSMKKLMTIKINKKFYKKLGFWVGLSLCYEAINIFKDSFFSFNGLINIIGLILGLAAIYLALTEKKEN